MKQTEFIADSVALSQSDAASQRREPAAASVEHLRNAAGTTRAETDAVLPMALLIDDDPAYRSGLSRYIRSNGFDCLETDSFAAAQEYMHVAGTAFVVVSELTVGSRHLFDCITQIRRATNASVLVLTSHLEQTEKIVALELGADDFIIKSVDRREILARVRAAVRRLLAVQSGNPQPDSGTPPGGDEVAGAWQFLRKRRELIDPAGRNVRLTAAEFDLLAAFVENTGRPLSREHLATAALGRHSYDSDRGIDNLVAKLRRKLGDSARLARMIKTARPVGYVFIGFSGAAEAMQARPGFAGRRRVGTP